MGLFGPSVPGVMATEEEHVLAMSKNLNLSAPKAYEEFHTFLSGLERIFIRRMLNPKYGDQAGPRYVKGCREEALLLASPITDEAFKELTRLSNGPNFGTYGHAVRFPIVSAILREWFGGASEADAWFKPYLKEYIKQQKQSLSAHG